MTDRVSAEVRECRAFEANLNVDGCRRHFVPNRHWQVFCQKACARAYHNRLRAAGEQLAQRLREIERRLEQLEAALNRTSLLEI